MPATSQAPRPASNHAIPLGNGLSYRGLWQVTKICSENGALTLYTEGGAEGRCDGRSARHARLRGRAIRARLSVTKGAFREREVAWYAKTFIARDPGRSHGEHGSIVAGSHEP